MSVQTEYVDACTNMTQKLKRFRKNIIYQKMKTEQSRHKARHSESVILKAKNAKLNVKLNELKHVIEQKDQCITQFENESELKDVRIAQVEDELVRATEELSMTQ